ncbi:MAG: triple tyrosine motif-containing protein [Paludibacter sp.]|jgi:ligand-binding sensor domain-containing protein/DNA-binding CsgD family transcriptional regulator|nr:triple tyrosine motif-containing protein [Paludibacter sp.]
MIKRTDLILVAIVLSQIAMAIHPVVRNFSRKEYRSGTQNWAIAQDNDNIMYFANNEGLLIFDGKNWKTVPIRNGTNVRSLVFDGDKRLYASTFNEFGYFGRSSDGTIQYYSLSEPLGVKHAGSNELYTIHLNSSQVYFQGEKTIYKYNGTEALPIPFNHRIETSDIVNNILFVAGQNAGLFMLNGSMFVRIPGSELLTGKKIVSLLPFQTNKVLVVTAFDGVYLYDGLSVVPFVTGVESFLRSNQVFCAATNGKKLVFGTVQRGIAIQNLYDNEVMYVNTFSGLQNNTVLSMAFDNMENLWLGLDKGIDYVLLNTPVSNIFGTYSLYGSGYSSHIRNNKIYFGTNQGLYISSYPLINRPEPIQLQMIRGMEGQVWCLKEIDNTLFCGDDQGAFIIHSDRVEQIRGLPGVWNFISLKNRKDVILGCSYQGLFILKKIQGSWKFSHYLRGNFNESSPMFEEDSDGSIWMSHWQNGLFRLFLNASLDSIKKVVLYNQDKGLPANTNNTLFRVKNEIIFSSERGLFSYNRKTDRMEENAAWNNLFSGPPSYMRLHESPAGDVWCVSGRFIGLARKNKDTTYTMDSLSYRILQSKLLVGFENFNFIDKYRVIVSNEDGFSRIDTRPQSPTNNTFRVLINTITAINNRSEQQQSRISVNRFDTTLVFGSSYNTLRFSFNAPEYRNDGLVEYACKLENYDENWSDFTAETTKEYSKLGRGEYVFRVKARDLLEFNETETTIIFRILPAWYETNTAYIIYGIFLLLAIGALGMFVNYRSKQGAVKMKELKEKEMQEQKKIFDEETQAKKKEIKELKNQQLQYELRHKAQELASSTMNIIRKNEILLEIIETLNKTAEDIRKKGDPNTIISRLTRVERNIRQNIENDNNWKRFEENFDLVYENYLKRLGEEFPELNVTDKKICAYIKMDLSSKDMAPLLNMSVRSIETNRYRIRKKLDLSRDVNLSDYLQKR